MGVGVGSSLELDAAFGHLGMKHWFVVLLCLALIAFLVVESAPARAGGTMKKGRGGSKGGSRGSGKSNHPKGGGDDSGIGGHGVKTEKPPCVGICHYNRIFGIVTPEPKPREVCVGLCYLNKLNLSQGLPGVLWKRGPG